MHRVLRRRVFTVPSVPVAAETLDPVYAVAPHGHDFLEIAVVERGTATHVSAGGQRRLRPGSVLVIRPGAWHGYRDCRGLAVHNVYVGAEVFQRELSWVREDPRLGPLLWPEPDDNDRYLGAAARDRLRGWISALQGTERAPAWWLGHLLLVVNEIADSRRADLPLDQRSSTHRAVLHAAALLEDDVARPWLLADLATEVNLAPAYLVRLFRKQVGLAPLAYLARLRAERAAGMLLETDLTVAAIGGRVGWSDPNYMSRRFRACFGVSPRDYRAAFRK